MAGEKWAELLGETAELFRITVENLPINLVLYDRDYRILYMNPALATICAAICKRTPEELVGMRGPELWPPPIWDPLFEHTERAVATRARQSYDLATNLPGRGPSVREWTVVPLVGPGGDIDRMLAMSIDVTEQRRMVQELREADQRKSDFIAVLSHELRNPLAAIRLSLDVMEHGAPGSEEAVARRGDHRSAGGAAGPSGRRSAGRDTHDAEQDPAAAAAAGPERAGARHDRRQPPRTWDGTACASSAKLASAPIHVDADGVRIAQVLTNLLANAVKHTPRRRDGDGVGLVGSGGRRGAARDGQRRRHRPRAAPRLFEPFMQAEVPLARSGGGLGLGLALVKGLVELHGGSVSASSAGKGQGAEFVVSLPVAAAVAGDARAATPASGLRARRRVLVIEDAADVATAMRLVAGDGRPRGRPLRTTAPTASRQALALRPEVVLCDIGLPGMDGYAVARTMRADPALREAFLVALSGYTQAADVARARAAGFDEHLAKPPSIDKVRRILDALQTR